MPIKTLPTHYAFENTATIYDEEALTALELAGRTTAKINELVTEFNALDTETGKRLDAQDKAIPVKVSEAVEDHIKSGDFDDQIDKYAGNIHAAIDAGDAALSARMDTFTKLGAGSTTGDAELIDARVSHMGQTHTNLGGHLRVNNALTRLHGQPDCVKERDIYSRFTYAWGDGKTHDGTGNCVSIVEPLRFDRTTTIRTIPGYRVSVRRWSDANKTTMVEYMAWDTSHTLEPDNYYTISLNRADDGFIGLDEGYALEFVEPFYYGVYYGNVLDTILPLFRFGGMSLDNDALYSPNDKTAMYTHNGFKLDQSATIHVIGDSDVAFHTFSNEIISRATFTGDTGWCKTLTIPADTFGVIYFRKSASRPEMCIDDLKLIQSGVGYDNTLENGTINRRYSEPSRIAVAHRGYSYYGSFSPENTLPAFRMAKAMGFDWVEMDVRITADGIPVICHDVTVDRTSNGTGYVSDMTLAELKLLDFSVACSSANFRNTRIPTLEEALITCKNLDLKIYLEVEPECEGHEAGIVELVKMYSMENAVKYVSFSQTVLANIANFDPAAPLGLNVTTPTTAILSAIMALRTGANDVSLNAQDITAELVTACKTQRVPLEVWCPNDAEVIKKLDPYIRSVCSDYLNYKNIMYNVEMEGV